VKPLAALLLLALALTACGKKPGTLRPSTDESSPAPTYPRTYPTK
jgi:predicted small lipoprotein YifL